MARASLLLLTALLVLTISVGPAEALVPVKTTTTIVITPVTPDTLTLSGEITTRTKNKGGLGKRARRAAARKCLKGRDISLSYLGREIGETVTDKAGRWSVTVVKPPTGTDVKVLVARDIRGDVLCGVISQQSQPVP